MNRLIIAIGLLLTASLDGLAQGTGGGIFDFTNVGTPDADQIYVGQYLGPVKAEGTDYQIAIFWGLVGTPENGLTQIGSPTSFLTGVGAGQFSGGLRVVSGLNEDGDVIALQARAWYAGPGGDATWEAAIANPAGQTGKGPVFEMATLDPAQSGTIPAPAVGNEPAWLGFAVAVPEPSTWALAGLGAASLFFLRRRK